MEGLQGYMVAALHRGTVYRQQSPITPIIGTPQKGTPNLGETLKWRYVGYIAMDQGLRFRTLGFGFWFWGSQSFGSYRYLEIQWL